MEKNYNQLISRTYDPDTLIKYLKFYKLIEEIKKNTKVKYIVKEIESEIYDDNFDDFDIEYICTVEATLYEKYVCTYEDIIRENGVTIAKEQGEILTENNPAIDHDIEEMICSTYLAREAIIEKLNITEEKYNLFFLESLIATNETKIKQIDKNIEEQNKMIENAKLKIESLQGMKEMIFQETCALLDQKEKERIKSIGLKV